MSQRKKACIRCLKAECNCHIKTTTTNNSACPICLKAGCKCGSTNRTFDDGRKRYDYQWRKYRLSYLADHPLCVSCLANDETTEATVVDHIIPVRIAPERFYDVTNHQALCATCHNLKTASGA
tara:strand:+ start:582 stop:950 length:369 start_codon:yes stop_codon:yes gene_type:complete